jgi:hypothetical protein
VPSVAVPAKARLRIPSRKAANSRRVIGVDPLETTYRKGKWGSRRAPSLPAVTGSLSRPAGKPRSEALRGAVAEVAATVAGRRAIDGLVDERGIGHEFRQGASPAPGDRRVVAAVLSKPRSIS